MRHCSTKPHLEEVHRFWKEHIQPEDLVIDATCGNGHDTLLLSQLAKKVIAIDLQEEAIDKARSVATSDNVFFFCQSHETFPAEVQPGTVALIAYNLGYLPGGNKEIITQASSTVISIQNGLPLLKMGGAMTLVCYSGHSGGELEEGAVLEFIKSLDKTEYLVTYTQWPNRKKHPSLIKVGREQVWR